MPAYNLCSAFQSSLFGSSTIRRLHHHHARSGARLRLRLVSKDVLVSDLAFRYYFVSKPTIGMSTIIPLTGPSPLRSITCVGRNREAPLSTRRKPALRLRILPPRAFECPSNRRSGIQSDEPHNTRRFKDYCLLHPTLDPTTKRKLHKMLVEAFREKPLLLLKAFD
ncbi:jg6128 [Pararge aegeria aegeria]|uniref:Jg6128 protein n=1 Tax=Pararge aegeria aegeria TaxID=348720 RepID=A0A8S4RFF9_9NEOP|nr:jg6128 [Pararge aegeria aegeria]